MSAVDYDRRLYRTYRAGRSLSADTARLWMDAVAARVRRARGELTILDLGAGTGRFSVPLADTFEARVVGIEPSAKMRADAERGSAHPRVVYRDGTASAIPAEGATFDFAFLSMVMQEIDPSLAAHCERMKRRALSSFELIDGAEFEEGLARMRAAIARERTATPIRERIDLLIFRRAGR